MPPQMPKPDNTIDLQVYREKMEMKEASDANEKPDSMTIATALMDDYDFIVLGNDDRAPLAVYLDDKGIYSTSDVEIKRRILYLAPDSSIPFINEVMLKIMLVSSDTNRRELTHDPDLIPVNNGIYNRKTDKLEPFSPEYIFTSKIATDYNPDATEPQITMPDGKVWTPTGWLEEMADYDAEVYQLMQQVIAASINGNYSYHQAIFLKGKGNAGKGTFQQLITNIDGPENVASLKVNHFQDRFGLAVLEGKTVCIGDDIAAGIYIDDSSNFNSVVTGDPVLIERKNKDPYMRALTLTVIQSTNEMPHMRNRSNGTMRRLVIIPFVHNFTADTERRYIKDDYIGRPDVCQWFLKQALHMKFSRFLQPKKVKEELAEYQKDNDPVADFVTAVMDKQEIKEIPTGALYEYYRAYTGDAGNTKPLGRRTFTNQLMDVLNDRDWVIKKVRADDSWQFGGDIEQKVGANLDSYKNKSLARTPQQCLVRVYHMNGVKK